MNNNINKDRVNTFTKQVIGCEKELSAHADFETSAKRLLFKIAVDGGYTWSEKEKPSVAFDFKFINKAVCAASAFVGEHYEKYHKNEKRDPDLETTLLGGFHVWCL